MLVQKVQLPEDGNPHYPLPPDYLDLSVEGKRKARVNACRQWLIPWREYRDPAQHANALIESIRFFDFQYLHPDPEADFDPMFYDDVPLSTPEMHWTVARQWAAHRLNLAILPRGSGKSTLCRKDMILRLLTRPMYTIVYATSTHDNAKITGQICRDQLYENSRIREDWACEYGSQEMRPTKGDAPTGVELFYLNNGSWLQSRSAESRQRGLRPRRYRLDDPEYDPKVSTSMAVLRSYVDQLVFRIVIPMVLRWGCGADWLATFVSKRHYAWHAMDIEVTDTGEVKAADSRFDLWSRLLVRAVDPDPEKPGRLLSCWPEMWPATRDDKTGDQVSLEEVKELIGSAAFNAEFLGAPGDADDAYFPPLTREKHGWWLENVDSFTDIAPWKSTTLVCWMVGTTRHTESLADFLANRFVFITVDYSYTETAHSDYKVATVFAFGRRDNTLFTLDQWAKKGSADALNRAAFHLADKWRAGAIFPEVVKESFTLYQSMVQIVSTKLTQEMGLTHVPRIIPIKPGTTSKVDKIASLLIRFEHGLLKFPLWRKNVAPWRDLFDQIEGFNPEANDGGLEKDDHLDTISMAHLFVVKGRLPRLLNVQEEEVDAVDMILNGTPFLESGASLGMGVSWEKIPLSRISPLLVPPPTAPIGRTKV